MRIFRFGNANNLFIAFVVTVGLSITCLAVPARAVEPAVFSEMLDKLQTQRRTQAAQAALDARALLQDDTLSPPQIFQLVSVLSAIQSADLKDIPAALASFDDGLARLRPIAKSTPQQVYLLLAKARLLLSSERAPEAEAFLEKEWPGLPTPAFRFVVLPVYLQALQEAKKNEAAAQLAHQTIQSALPEASSQPVVMDAVVNHFLNVGDGEAALGWAKLYFMLCAYDEKALQSATQLLSKVWMTRDLSPAKTAESIQALQDASKPNPLRDVALPAFDEVALRKQLATTVASAAKITLLLALNDDREAMLAARRLMLSQPQSSEGVLQVCRVFKAHDLHLGRATAFLEYYKNGKGENPITAFLAETEKK